MLAGRTWRPEPKRVDDEVANFGCIWADKAKRVIVLGTPEAVRRDLMRFMPDSDLPARLRGGAPDPPSMIPVVPAPEGDGPGDEDAAPAVDLRSRVWDFIDRAPALPDGGARVGEATAAVTPWPHQVRAFERLYAHWPPRLLIADEVGLGKTIQAGLLLRQAWLAGRAKRILILARLPSTIAGAALSGEGRRGDGTGRPARAQEAAPDAVGPADVVEAIERQVREARTGGFDIDTTVDADVATPVRALSPVAMDDLDRVISSPDLMPPGTDIQPLGNREYGLLAPGMRERLRVTTHPAYYEEPAESVELWSPGNPLFTPPEFTAGVKDDEFPAETTLKELLDESSTSTT